MTDSNGELWVGVKSDLAEIRTLVTGDAYQAEQKAKKEKQMWADLVEWAAEQNRTITITDKETQA
jgi:hypothetical protein